MRELLFTLVLSVSGFSALSTLASAQGKGYHCEVKRKGKVVDLDNVKDRRECKKKGGKWVKAHDHDHEHGEEGHGHSHE